MFCQSACMNSPDCLAYNFNKIDDSEQRCQIYNSISSFQPDNNYDSCFTEEGKYNLFYITI